MADNEIKRLETLKKKRKEYDDQRLKAQEAYDRAKKAGDSEEMVKLESFIKLRTTIDKKLNQQIQKEEKIYKAKEKEKKLEEERGKTFEKLAKSKEQERKKEKKFQENQEKNIKTLNDIFNKPYEDRAKIIKSTMAGVRNMNKEVMDMVNLERSNLNIRELQKQGRVQEAKVLESITDDQIEMLNIKTRQGLLDFDAAKALEDIEDKSFEIAQLEQDILDGKVQNTDKAEAMVEALKEELKASNQILKNTKQKSDEAKAQKAAADKLRESSMDLVDSAEKQVMFAKELVKQMLKNPIFIMGAAVMAIVKAFGFLNEKTKEFQEKVGGSVTQGKQLRNELAGAQIHAKALGYDAAAAAGALSEAFGSLKSVNNETVMAMGRMEKGLGVSVATSAKLLASMTSLTGKSQASAVSTMEFGASLAMANDVAP